MGEWDTGYATITSAANDDTLLIRDVSDNGVIAAGKVKQIAVSDLLEAAPAATGSVQGTVKLTGDLGGTAASPEVAKIQGTAIDAPSGGATAYLNADGGWTEPSGGGGGGGAVDSVNTRTGDVVLTAADVADGSPTDIRYLRDDGTYQVPRGVIPLFAVSATQEGGAFQGMSMALRVLTGAADATDQPGATAGGTGSSHAVTPTADGSLIYGALLGFADGTFAPTAATFVFQDIESGASAAQFRSADYTTASSAITVGNGGSDDGIGIAVAEILAASGATLTEDASSPSPVAWDNVTTAATAPFQPPANSLLVLAVSAIGSFDVGGVTTMAIADTSGLGLTWTELVVENGTGNGYVGVWIAEVPAGYALALPVVDDQTPGTMAGLLAGGGGPFGGGFGQGDSSAGLFGLLAALANRNTAACNIAVIGDSITEGNGATAFTSRYAGQANRATRQRYPTVAGGSTGGLGFVPMQSTGETTYTWPVTLATGSIAGTKDIGPVRGAVSLTSAGTFTFTAPAGSSSCKVMYYNDNSGAQFSYKINSGSPTTVTASGTVADGALTSSITITSGQVLTVAWVSGTIWLEGILHFAGDESSGVTWHGCGHYGWTSGDWIAAQSGAIDWRASIAALSPAAIAINVGTNDPGTFSAPQSQANLLSLISFLRGATALESLPVLLIVPVAGTSNQAFAAAWRQVPSLAAGVMVCDVNYRMPNSTAWAAGYEDSVHPADNGHALYGEIVAASVRIA